MARISKQELERMAKSIVSKDMTKARKSTTAKKATPSTKLSKQEVSKLASSARSKSLTGARKSPIADKLTSSTRKSASSSSPKLSKQELGSLASSITSKSLAKSRSSASASKAKGTLGAASGTGAIAKNKTTSTNNRRKDLEELKRTTRKSLFSR